MSTKLHHGYRLAEDVDLFAFTARLRDVMNPVRDRLDAQMLMATAITAIDAADAKGEPRPTTPLTDAMLAFDDAQRKLNPMHRGHDPHRFEVSFGRDEQTGRILALLFADRSVYVEAWEALPEVEPYGYWNNTDAPDDVTDAEWDDRRKAWDRMLPGHSAPVSSMLSFSLRPSPPLDPGMIRLATPRHADADAEAARRDLLRSVAKTSRRRARSLAINLLTAETVRRAEASDPGSKPDVARIASHLLFTGPGDEDNFEAVIDAVEQALNSDVVTWVLGDVSADEHERKLRQALPATSGRVDVAPAGPLEETEPSPYALDLTTVHAAVATHLDGRLQ